MSALRFKLTALSKWSIGLTTLVCLAYLVSIGHSLWLLSFVQRILSGISVADVEAERIDNFGQLVGYGATGAIVVTLIVNGVWIYRASWNARQLQPNQERITPGWAIGFYFVPILNLFKPFSAMTQTWNSSHDPTGDFDRSSPAFMAVWWLCWVVASLASRVSNRMFERAETNEALRNAAILDIAVTIVILVAAVLFIKIIRAITTAQQGRVPAELSTNPTEGVSS